MPTNSATFSTCGTPRRQNQIVCQLGASVHDVVGVICLAAVRLVWLLSDHHEHTANKTSLACS